MICCSNITLQDTLSIIHNLHQDPDFPNTSQATSLRQTIQHSQAALAFAIKILTNN